MFSDVVDDVHWFDEWASKVKLDNRTVNAVGRGMVEYRVTIDKLITLNETDFIGWHGMGKKSRDNMMSKMDELREDWRSKDA